jgi:hypothetical protein
LAFSLSSKIRCAPVDRAPGSPDRVDALVWAASELMIAPMKGYAIYEIYRQMAEALGHEPRGM